MEVGNSREKALPKIFNLTVLNLLDVYGVSRMERTSRLWREFLQTPDGQGVWQRVVHEVVGKVQIESYKLALGLRAGQPYEQERLDLQSRNWRRIMRMHRANIRFPHYKTDHKVTLLANHTGPVLCMGLGGPYLFSGGADGKLLMYRVPLFLTFTPEREREFKKPPAPSRYFGQPKTKNGLNFAHDGPILAVVAGKDFVMSAGVDGIIKLWKMESAPGSACARRFLFHKLAVWCMALGQMDHDGEQIEVLISGSADRTIAVWNIWGPKGARPLLRLEGHFAGVSALCLVPMHHQLVSGSEDATMRVWSLETGRCETVLEGHTQAITALVAWHGAAAGRQYDVIFSASRGGDVRMWDRQAAVQLLCVQAHAGPVASLTPSLVPECCMVSAGVDGVLRLWRTDDLVNLRTIHAPKPSQIAAEEENLRRQMELEHASRLADIEKDLANAALQHSDGLAARDSPTSSTSPGNLSPLHAGGGRGYSERMAAMADNDVRKERATPGLSLRPESSETLNPKP